MAPMAVPASLAKRRTIPHGGPAVEDGEQDRVLVHRGHVDALPSLPVE